MFEKGLKEGVFLRFVEEQVEKIIKRKMEGNEYEEYEGYIKTAVKNEMEFIEYRLWILINRELKADTYLFDAKIEQIAKDRNIPDNKRTIIDIFGSEIKRILYYICQVVKKILKKLDDYKKVKKFIVESEQTKKRHIKELQEELNSSFAIDNIDKLQSIIQQAKTNKRLQSIIHEIDREFIIKDIDVYKEIVLKLVNYPSKAFDNKKTRGYHAWSYLWISRYLFNGNMINAHTTKNELLQNISGNVLIHLKRYLICIIIGMKKMN